MDKKLYEEFKEILRSELVPALGCTEPGGDSLRRSRSRKASKRRDGLCRDMVQRQYHKERQRRDRPQFRRNERHRGSCGFGDFGRTK